MVDVYADRGVSGTSAKKRPDFQRMLSDCRQGRIDKILVDPDIFIARSNEYAAELREAKRKREKLLDEDGGDDRIAKTEELLETLEALPDFLPEYDGGIFDELVERVELTADDRVIFHLTNGLALTETIHRSIRG